MAALTPLFRPEVLAARAGASYGVVLLTGNRARRWLCLLFSAIAIALVLALGAGSYARTATVAGIVLPADGIKRVVASTGGRVTAVMVNEGQMVSRGQPLLAMASLRTDSLGADPDATQLALLSARRGSLQKDLLQLRDLHAARGAAAARAIEDQQSLQLQLAQSLQLQSRRTELADTGLQRFRQLASAGHVAVMQVQEQEVQLLEQQQRLVDLQHALLEAQRQLRGAQAAYAEQRMQAAREITAAERNLVALEQELTDAAAHSAWLIPAPASGRISAISIRVGEAASAGQWLLALVNPAAPLVVELYAPSRAAGLVRIGQQVSLRYQAFPFQKFGQYGGTVQQISGNALQAAELAPEVAGLLGRNGESLYRVRVALATETVRFGGRSLRLQPGTLLDASIRLESRRLYEWLLAPLAELGARR